MAQELMTDRILKNLPRALNEYCLKVASVNKVSDASGLEYRVYLTNVESLKALQRLKKDIAIRLGIKDLEIELSQDYATLKFPSGK